MLHLGRARSTSERLANPREAGAGPPSGPESPTLGHRTLKPKSGAPGPAVHRIREHIDGAAKLALPCRSIRDNHGCQRRADMATDPVEHINGQIKRKSSCVTNRVPCPKRICTQHRPQSLWEQTLVIAMTSPRLRPDCHQRKWCHRSTTLTSVRLRRRTQNATRCWSVGLNCPNSHASPLSRSGSISTRGC